MTIEKKEQVFKPCLPEILADMAALLRNQRAEMDPLLRAQQAELMDGVTTIKFTATVEFTPKQWDKYREDLCGSETPATNTKACEELMEEAEYGLKRQLDNQGIAYAGVEVRNTWKRCPRSEGVIK